MALPQTFVTELFRVLEEGLFLSGAELLQIESATGAGDAESLAALLSAPGPDRDLVLSLVFSPGPETRQALEAHLAGIITAPEDEKSLIAAICGRVTDCRFFLSDFGVSLTVEPPDWALAFFVTGLRLVRTPPPEILAALEDFVSPDLRPAAIVTLRDAPAPWSEKGTSFVRRLILKGLVKDREGLVVLSFLLDLISELSSNDDPYEALFRKAAWAKKNLAASRRGADVPFEVKMAMGVRPAYVDEPRMESALASCRAAARVLFGPGFDFSWEDPDRDEPVSVDVASFLAMGRKVQ